MARRKDQPTHRVEFTFWHEDVLQKRSRINEKGPCQKHWHEDTHDAKMPRMALNLRFLRNELVTVLVQLLKKRSQRLHKGLYHLLQETRRK